MFKHQLNQAVTIASGATASSEADTHGLMLVGIEMPSAFTGTQLSVYAGQTSGSTKAAYDDVGAPITASVAASRYVDMSWAKLIARYVSVVSNASEAADRSITLVFGEA